MRNPGSFLMNGMGIHISLFQLFVISTTHFSSPALQFVFYVLWSPRNAHIHGRESVKAEMPVTLRKRLNLTQPLYPGSWGRSGSVRVPCPTVLRAGVRAPASGRHTGLNPVWKCFICNFHNGGFQGGLRRVMGDELGF